MASPMIDLGDLPDLKGVSVKAGRNILRKTHDKVNFHVTTIPKTRRLCRRIKDFFWLKKYVSFVVEDSNCFKSLSFTHSQSLEEKSRILEDFLKTVISNPTATASVGVSAFFQVSRQEFKSLKPSLDRNRKAAQLRKDKLRAQMEEKQEYEERLKKFEAVVCNQKSISECKEEETRKPKVQADSNKVFEQQVHQVEIEDKCFENERYYPINGWTNSLLPTDYYQWSSENGGKDCKRESFKSHLMEGAAIIQGWTPSDWEYAVDFPRGTNLYKWHSSKNGCFVRRRQWTRKVSLTRLPRRGSEKLLEYVEEVVEIGNGESITRTWSLYPGKYEITVLRREGIWAGKTVVTGESPCNDEIYVRSDGVWPTSCTFWVSEINPKLTLQFEHSYLAGMKLRKGKNNNDVKILKCKLENESEREESTCTSVSSPNIWVLGDEGASSFHRSRTLSRNESDPRIPESKHSVPNSDTSNRDSKVKHKMPIQPRQIKAGSLFGMIVALIPRKKGGKVNASMSIRWKSNGKNKMVNGEPLKLVQVPESFANARCYEFTLPAKEVEGPITLLFKGPFGSGKRGEFEIKNLSEFDANFKLRIPDAPFKRQSNVQKYWRLSILSACVGNVAEIENSKKLGMVQLYVQQTKENLKELYKKLVEREGYLEEFDQRAESMEDAFEIFKNKATLLKYKDQEPSTIFFANWLWYKVMQPQIYEVTVNEKSFGVLAKDAKAWIFSKEYFMGIFAYPQRSVEEAIKNSGRYKWAFSHSVIDYKGTPKLVSGLFNRETVLRSGQQFILTSTVACKRCMENKA